MYCKNYAIKFVFSKKATKIDEIFDLTFTAYVALNGW